MITVEIVAQTTAARMPLTEHVRVGDACHLTVALAIRDAHRRARQLASCSPTIRWVAVQVRRAGQPPTDWQWTRNQQRSARARSMSQRLICRIQAMVDGNDVLHRQTAAMRDELAAMIDQLSRCHP